MRSLTLCFLGCMALGTVVMPWAAAQTPWSGTEVLILETPAYTRRVFQLLRSARESVRVCLAECDFPESENHILRRLLQELVHLSERGIPVEVFIAGHPDREDSAKGSEAARKYLYEKGVRVFFDSKERRTRYNMIVVDDFVAVLGSAGWTEETLTRENHLVLWIESTDLARSLARRLDGLRQGGKTYGTK